MLMTIEVSVLNLIYVKLINKFKPNQIHDEKNAMALTETGLSGKT